MDPVLKIIEKILYNIFLSLLLAVACFSFMTGKFPPARDDIKKALALGKEILFSSSEYNHSVKALGSETPNLEQLVELQRIGLRRSEAALQLSQMMVRLGQAPAAEHLSEQLQRAAMHLDQVDDALKDIHSNLKKIGADQ